MFSITVLAQDIVGDFPASVRIASIVVNGLVRMAAIAAGVYVVKLGHDTLVRGIKGDFEFTGSFGRLKGSAPGLLFVLLGCLAIGWALQQAHSGRIDASVTEAQPQPKDTTDLRGTSVPPPPPPDSGAP